MWKYYGQENSGLPQSTRGGGVKYRDSKSTELTAQYTMLLVRHPVAAVPGKDLTMLAC